MAVGIPRPRPQTRNVSPIDFRLRPPPAELDDVPEGTCPEVRQIIEEAMRMEYSMMNESLRENIAKVCSTAPDGDAGHGKTPKGRPKRLGITRRNGFWEAKSELASLVPSL